LICTMILKMQGFEELLNIWIGPRLCWGAGKTEMFVSGSIQRLPNDSLSKQSLSIWLSFAFLRNVLESFHDVLCTTKHYEMKFCEMACSQGLQLLFNGLGKGQIGSLSQAHHCLTAQSYKIFCLNQFYLRKRFDCL